jgi:hypothetical protein
MALNVYGTKEGFSEEDIIRTALSEGVRDDDGNVFEIITIMSLRHYDTNSTTHGFIDTIIDARGGEIKVSHRADGNGRIKWLNGRGGKTFAQLAKIPHNVELLAKNYYAGLWIIKDPIQDAEIKALADERRKEMSEIEIKEEDGRHNMLHKAGYGGKFVNSQGKTEQEISINIKESELQKKQIELKNKEANLRVKEEQIAKNTIKSIESGGIITKHTRESLLKEGVFRLRSIARSQFGLKIDRNNNKIEIIDSILGEQDKLTAEKEPKEENKTVPITG